MTFHLTCVHILFSSVSVAEEIFAYFFTLIINKASRPDGMSTRVLK